MENSDKKINLTLEPSVEGLVDQNPSLASTKQNVYSEKTYSVGTIYESIPLSFILVAVVFIGKEIYNGIFIQDSISNITHIIGGIVGSISGYALNKKSSKSW